VSQEGLDISAEIKKQGGGPSPQFQQQQQQQVFFGGAFRLSEFDDAQDSGISAKYSDVEAGSGGAAGGCDGGDASAAAASPRTRAHSLDRGTDYFAYSGNNNAGSIGLTHRECQRTR
jgi:hypothetical protein